ncbi:uncharacterized protein B0P05DRAFT_545234 [Gilbertella persicaria]|uniref:uncharacterized protein n=1 Tax=Gilbertella persicaria TaxID=101096 RepID=UPI002220ABF3|nr:uncharacterized protein B0P05DRAFT_545234 [Gilbertella persicaria]KAI8076625.1 hypothetical protein B0P05DRAFT_545234 [Gilbertella persicaria]
MTESNLDAPNYPYRFCKDFSTSFKRWFFKGQRAELKGLELEHVLNGVTKQPISLYDFRLYLQNKEHTAENLEFHYWYQDYKRRFEALPDIKKAKSPPPEEPFRPDFDKEPNSSDRKDYQPFRTEIDATLKTFFHKGDSLKELFLDPSVLSYTLCAAAKTTHPDVFEPAYHQTYKFMRETSFKNFIHVGVQNVRYGFVVAELTMGCLNLSLLPMVLFNTFAMHMSRWTRLFVFALIFTFVSMILCGRTGFCLVRCLFKRRQVPDFICAQYFASSKNDNKRASRWFKGRVEASDDLESNSKEEKRDLTPILDQQVVKYGRVRTNH